MFIRYIFSSMMSMNRSLMRKVQISLFQFHVFFNISEKEHESEVREQLNSELTEIFNIQNILQTRKSQVSF